MMKLKYILFFMFLSTVILLDAQKNDTELPAQLSLKEAQAFAMKHHPRVMESNLQNRIAEKQISKEKWKKIPSVYGSYDLRYNLIIPTTPVPAQAFQPNAKKGEVLPLRFSTDWSSSAGINLDYDLFNPQKNGQLKVAEQKFAIQKIESQVTQHELNDKVGKDYIACVIAKVQLKLAIADTLAKTKIVAVTQNQYNQGRIKLPTLSLMQKSRNQSLSNFYNAQYIYHSAKQQLIVDLGFSPSSSQNITLTDSLAGLLTLEKTQKQSTQNHLSIQKLQQEQLLNNLQLKNVKRGFLPTVSLKGFYGGNYYDNDFRLFNADKWYGNSYLGLSVKIPITAGFERTQEIQILKLQAKEKEVQLKDQHHQIELQQLQAQQKVDVERKKVENAMENKNLMFKNWKVANQQLAAGRLLIKDWLDSDFLYKQAKTDYLQAVYDFLLAQLDMEKSAWQ